MLLVPLHVSAQTDQAPVVSVQVEDVTSLVHGPSYRFSLYDYFDGAIEDCTATSSDETLVQATHDGSRVRIRPVGVGTATVTLTVDNAHGEASQSFEVTVNPRAPEIAQLLPDLSLRVHESVTIELADAFSGMVASYSAVGSSQDAARVSLAGSSLTVTALAAGMADVTATATNVTGEATQTFAVTVRDVPPAVAAPPEEVRVRVGEVAVVDIAEAFSGTALRYSAASSSDATATVTLDGTTLAVTGVVAGSTSVTLTATNSEGSASQEVPVTVEDVPPAVDQMLQAVSVRVGEVATVELSGAFSGTALRFSAASSSETMASASVDGTVVSITGVAAGPVTVTVTATNSAGSASQDIAVLVEDVPPAVAEELAPVSLRVGDTLTVELMGAFSGTALQYSAVSSSMMMATVSVADSALSIDGLVAGPVTVTVTATNTAGSATQDLAVTVEDVPPAVAAMLPDVEIRVGDSMTVELAGTFTGSALQYSAMSSSEAAATVSVSGSSLTLDALAAGGATVTVMATNSADSAQQAFEVTVRDVPPGTVGAIPDIHLVAGGAPAVINLADYFSGSALVFGASSPDAAVSVSVAGAQLTVAPAIEGMGTVNVTAGNTEGVVSVNVNAMVTTDAAEVDAIERSLAALAGATLSSVNSAFNARFRGAASSVPAAAPLALDNVPGGHSGPFGGLAAAGVGTDWSAGGWDGSGGGFGTQWNGSGWNGSGRVDGYGYGNGPGLFGASRPMSGGSFVVPLAASGGAGGLGDWSLWGHADWQSFDGQGVDGDLTSVYVGTDVTVGENWLIGVAASQSDGDVDYRFAGQAASGTGSLSTEMLSIFPYAKLQVDQCTELWAILGFGNGDIESRRSVVLRTSEADLTMSLFSAGGSRVISAGEGWSITVLGDASAIEMDTDGITGAITSVDVSVRRIRAGIQGARTVQMDNGSRVVLFGEVAARNDSGDGDTGGGAEVSAGVRFNTTDRFSFEVKGRLLATHSEDDVEESAFSVSARLLPRSNGGGLSLALSSRQGADFGLSGMMPGVDYDALRRSRGIADQWGFDARIGYGLPDTGLPGVLTPFVTLDAGATSRRGARVGARFDAGGHLVRMLTVEVAAGQTYHIFDDSMAGLIELRGELRF